MADTVAPPVTSAPSRRTVVITPDAGALNLRDLWEYRDLLFFLVWRDVKVRYKQTIFGAAWAIIQPFFTMVVFSIFFGQLAKMPSDGVPYPVFAYCALLPWQLFANAMNNASNSLVNNQHLIKKVYFPRLVVPIAAVLDGLVDFAVAFVVLLGMLWFYGVTPTWNMVWLPLFLLLVVVTALAVGLWLSALNVMYRDVRYTIGFLTQLWMFATPIAYPSSLVPEQWRAIYALNPMVGVVEAFRWAMLGIQTPPGPVLGASVTAVTFLLVGGLFFFKRMEQRFADVV